MPSQKRNTYRKNKSKKNNNKKSNWKKMLRGGARPLTTDEEAEKNALIMEYNSLQKDDIGYNSEDIQKLKNYLLRQYPKLDTDEKKVLCEILKGQNLVTKELNTEAPVEETHTATSNVPNNAGVAPAISNNILSANTLGVQTYQLTGNASTTMSPSSNQMTSTSPVIKSMNISSPSNPLLNSNIGSASGNNNQIPNSQPLSRPSLKETVGKTLNRMGRGASNALKTAVNSFKNVTDNKTRKISNNSSNDETGENPMHAVPSAQPPQKSTIEDYSTLPDVNQIEIDEDRRKVLNEKLENETISEIEKTELENLMKEHIRRLNEMDDLKSLPPPVPPPGKVGQNNEVPTTNDLINMSDENTSNNPFENTEWNQNGGRRQTRKKLNQKKRQHHAKKRHTKLRK